MTQYGYANMITSAKLLELGSVKNGVITVAGRRFTTLAAVFEPFPPRKLLAMMQDFVNGGGELPKSKPADFEGNPLPSGLIHLADFRVNGHRVSYA
jgi:hypothetical protein